MALLSDAPAPPRRPGGLGAAAPVVSLLDVDPDLAADIPSEGVAAARAAARAVVVRLGRGPWEPVRPARPGLGCLVLDGFVVRLVRVGRRESLELLGPGDLLRPWDEQEEGLVACEVRWLALTPVSLAALDARFAHAVRPWPQLHGALLARALRRARGQALQAAIGAHPGVDERLILLFCLLGGRAGRVTPEGVVVEMPLSHRLLAHAVRALRPSVTNGLLRLRDAGRLVRLPGRTWLVTHQGLAYARQLCEQAVVEA